MEQATIEGITEQRLRTDVLPPEGEGSTTTALPYKEQHQAVIKALKAEVDQLPNVVESKEQYDEMDKVRRRIVKHRTGVDKARKEITAPFTKLTGEVNAYLGTGPTSGLQLQIKLIENIIEERLKKYDDIEAERIRKEQERIQARTQARVERILNLGAKYESDAYSLGGKSVFSADVATMEDGTWSTIEAGFKEAADTIEKARVEQERKEREEREAREREVAKMKEERFASRVAELKRMGGKWNNEGDIMLVPDSISVLRSEMVDMEAVVWSDLLDQAVKAREHSQRTKRFGELVNMLPEGAVEYPDGLRGMGAHTASPAQMLEMDQAGTFTQWLEELKVAIAEFNARPPAIDEPLPFEAPPPTAEQVAQVDERNKHSDLNRMGIAATWVSEAKAALEDHVLHMRSTVAKHAMERAVKGLSDIADMLQKVRQDI